MGHLEDIISPSTFSDLPLENWERLSETTNTKMVTLSTLACGSPSTRRTFIVYSMEPHLPAKS